MKRSIFAKPTIANLANYLNPTEIADLSTCYYEIMPASAHDKPFLVHPLLTYKGNAGNGRCKYFFAQQVVVSNGSEKDKVMVRRKPNY